MHQEPYMQVIDVSFYYDATARISPSTHQADKKRVICAPSRHVHVFGQDSEGAAIVGTEGWNRTGDPSDDMDD